MSQIENTPVDRLLRLPEVLNMIGVSRPTLYRMIKAGTFPAPIKQGTISSWPQSKVSAYINSMLSAA